jgi:hypothetical protein
MRALIPTSPLKTVFISRWNVSDAEHIPIGIMKKWKWPPGVEKANFFYDHPLVVESDETR